jgi:hypothetical protein
MNFDVQTSHVEISSYGKTIINLKDALESLGINVFSHSVWLSSIFFNRTNYSEEFIQLQSRIKNKIFRVLLEDCSLDSIHNIIINDFKKTGPYSVAKRSEFNDGYLEFKKMRMFASEEDLEFKEFGIGNTSHQEGVFPQYIFLIPTLEMWKTMFATLVNLYNEEYFEIKVNHTDSVITISFISQFEDVIEFEITGNNQTKVNYGSISFLNPRFTSRQGIFLSNYPV